MRILYYDCFAGISGDMNLAALINIGVDEEYLRAELKKLNVTGWELKTTIDNRKGVFGTRVDVILNEHKPVFQTNINIGQHLQGNKHANYSHEQRNLKDIEQIIDNSGLNDNVKLLSKKILKKVAEAEAKVHNKPIDEIHFHEVGAVDSIVDIIGAAICIDYLKPDKIVCSPVELGSGMVKCEHGVFPVPAPATAEILKGVPVKMGKVSFEATTPTGAAIVAALSDEFTAQTNFEITKIGYGIGHKDSDIPNVLRVFWAESKESNSYPTEEAHVVECNIDDMNPEIYDYLFEKLFNIGVDDVYITPIVMKKSRPALTFSVLCKPAILNHVISFLLKETTTLGVRQHAVTKHILKREAIELDTTFGKVKAKKSYTSDNSYKIKPEYDDCLRIAKEHNLPLIEVMREIGKSINNE